MMAYVPSGGSPRNPIRVQAANMLRWAADKLDPEAVRVDDLALLESDPAEFVRRTHKPMPSRAFTIYSCGCAMCHSRPYSVMHVCPDCGNKRCPRATFHGYECNHSNGGQA